MKCEMFDEAVQYGILKCNVHFFYTRLWDYGPCADPVITFLKYGQILMKPGLDIV